MNAQGEFLFPPFRLDIRNGHLWREDQLIVLRPKTFAILRYLADNPGRLVKKEDVLEAVWGDTHVSEDGLRDYLREICAALGDDATAPCFVETVRGRGYRFIGHVVSRKEEAKQKGKIPSTRDSALRPPLPIVVAATRTLRRCMAGGRTRGRANATRLCNG